MKGFRRTRGVTARSAAAACFLSLALCTSAAADVETRSAQSIGTTISLREAAQSLSRNFAAVAGRSAPVGAASDTITSNDLKRVMETPDTDLPGGVPEAARFFLASPVDQQLASGPAAGGAPVGMTQAGLQHLLDLESNGELEAALLQGIGTRGGRHAASENRGYAALFRDPGVPAPVRAAMVGRLSDARLLDIVGHPDTHGNGRDRSDETGAFLGLARMSWLGTAEAEALAYYRVPFAMDRGSEDHDVSYWNGQAMHLSEKMIVGGKPGYVWELLAHEGGHAIFQLSGLQARTANDVATHKLTPHIDNIINEAFAGAFGNRAHVVLFGSGDKNVERHLQLFNDLFDSVANDKTFYANRYHVDTAAARSEIPAIKQVMAAELVPSLQGTFGLLGDPLLTLQLPVGP